MLANYAKWYSFTPPHWHDFPPPLTLLTFSEKVLSNRPA